MDSIFNWALALFGLYFTNQAVAKTIVSTQPTEYIPFDPATETGGYWADVQSGFDTYTSSPPSVNQQEANLKAFLKVIRVIESGDDYAAIVGGNGRITDFREHPWVLDPARPVPIIGGVPTNASGAYQFIAATPQYPNARTWQAARDQAGVRDFTPASQDAAAVVLLKWRGAYNDVLAGNFALAASKLVYEWEAFDRILFGSYNYSFEDIAYIYADAGGSFA